MPLNIVKRTIESEVHLLELTGKLALGRDSQQVEMVIQDCLKQNARKMILDLSGVDYIDSSGIGIVAWCAGRMKEAGGKLMIVGAAGRVLQLLKMTQVDSIVPVFETLDAALAAMSDGLAQPPATT